MFRGGIIPHFGVHSIMILNMDFFFNFEESHSGNSVLKIKRPSKTTQHTSLTNFTNIIMEVVFP